MELSHCGVLSLCFLTVTICNLNSLGFFCGGGIKVMPCNAQWLFLGLCLENTWFSIPSARE